MANTAPRLAAAGLSYPLAIEIARQFAAAAGDAPKLITLGVVPMQAQALAAGITGANITSEKLCAAMWPDHVARVIRSVWANP